VILKGPYMADISPAEVRNLILDFFSIIGEYEITNMVDVKIKVMLVDDVYSPISRDEILTLARCNLLLTPPGAVKTQITDCDDYVMQLKNEANAMYRQNYFAGRAAPVPPAVAIVISRNHAVNLFIEQDGQGNNTIWFIDASTPELQTTNDPAQAAQMMKLPPVKLIYM
jgi:hypothetical protein